MSAWTTNDTPKTNHHSSKMQHPDHVNSTDKPELRADAPSESGFNATDPTIFHNPNLLSKGQVGEGYRLLTKAEFENPGDPSSVTEFWHRGDEVWDERSHPGDALADVNTYRVPVAVELGAGARVRVIGTPWGFPNFTRHLGRVGKVEAVDRGHAARYHVKVDGSDVPIWYEVGAVDRDYADADAVPEAAEPAPRFGVGDRVRVTGPEGCVGDEGYVGWEGVVAEVDAGDPAAEYQIPFGDDAPWFPASSLEFVYDAKAGPVEPAPRIFRFKEGDRVTITGPTVCYDGSEVGNSGVVRVVDRADDEYPYRVAVGGDELNLRWFPESSLAPAEAAEDVPAVKKSLYVSAHFPDAAQADRVAILLNRAGYLVVSTWHAGELDATPSESAKRYFAQLDKADAVLLLSTPHRTTGGKFVEAGYALGKGKPVFVLGTRENWMLHHPKVSVFATVEELLNTGGPL